MKNFIATFFIASVAAFGNAAYANCSTHTYTINGKIVTCTTCCYYGNCTTNCF